MPDRKLNPGRPNKNSAAIIKSGRILEVDPSRWTCKVLPTGESSGITVTIPSLYSHIVNGEGIHYMPEVGAHVYYCHSSEAVFLPFLLLGGAAIAPKDFSLQDAKPGSLDMFRPIMSPGDITINTRDGNGLVLKRGGITELRATPLSKIMFNPVINQVLTIAENYRVQTFGGYHEWKNLRREEDSDGGLKTQMTTVAKQFATSKGYSVRMQMGATDGEEILLQTGDVADTPVETKTEFVTLSGLGEQYPIDVPTEAPLNDSSRVVDFRVYKDETKKEVDLEESFVLGMDREGDLQVESSGATLIDVDKWVEFRVDGNAPEIKTDEAGVRKVLVTAAGQGSTEPVIKGSTFLSDLSASLTEIQSALNGLGIPTPNTVTLLANIEASKTAGTPYLSTTLESE